MHNFSVEKIYMCPCRDADQNVILSQRQALIKFELRVCTERRPIALLCVLPRDFPFLPFPFSQDHCFRDDPQNPARGARDCYERICGNPRSNLHADDNGCVSSLIPRFCRPPAIPSSRVCATARSKEMQVTVLSSRVAPAS